MMKKILFFITIFGFSTLLSQSVVSLDGSNDYLTTTDTTGTKLEGDFTISGWVFLKGDATQQVFHNELFEIQYQGSYYRQFRIYPGGYSTTWGEASINEWHHIAVTRSSQTNDYDTLYVYVDGKQSLMFARDQSSTTTFDGTMYLGRDPDYGEYFRGFMDEFAIWNTVLDSNSVKELYNGGMPKSATSVKSSNVLSYWKMDDGTGTSATNAVSGSPSLSLQGATWSTFTQSAKPELLADIRSGYSGSSPKNPREYNSKLYFVANDGVKGDELWVYNPADSTTTRVTDISSGGNSGLTYSSTLIEYNGKLYFEGYESTYGAELYSYDGSSVTRVADVYDGSGSGYVKYPLVLNDKLYFVSRTNSYGYEWYSYDGSTVTRLTDIRSGQSDGVYAWGKAKVYNSKIYFPGYDSSKGVELYSYDETNGAQLVKDIYDGSSGSYPNYLTVFDGKLYLVAGYKAAGSAAPDNGMEAAGSESGMSHENKLLKYDGTDLTVIDLESSAQYVTLFGDSAVFNKKLYFQAYTTANGYELWSYDETDGGKMVADSIYPGSGGSYPYYITTFNNKLYFRATDGTDSWGGQGYELWYYDGVGFGRASDIYQGTSSSQPANLFATNDALYFSATNNTYGYELWGIRSADPKPTIASITSTTSDGTYKVGDAINITVNFSEAVSLSSGGSLTVTLETGTADRTVSITSISNATSAFGTYTVQSGDVSSDLTGNSVSISGSLSDASNQAMDSFTIGSNLAGSSALVIDGVLPTIASVKSTSDNATYSADSKINITVNFSEAVSISASGTLTVTLETGTTDRDVTITDISSTAVAKGTYIVQTGDSSADLDVKSIALSTDATLKDAAGNAMDSLSIHADSSLADFNNIKINTTKPGTPTNIVAKNRYSGIGLKWYKESSAAKYYVYRSGDNATFEKLSTEPTDTTFIDTLTAGSKYYYYVTAVNSAGTAGDTSKHVFGYATRIWWVDVTNGKDETRYGVSADSSFKTIEQAVKTNSSLVSGDTIYVKPSITSTNKTKYTGYYNFGGSRGDIDLGHSKDFILKSTAGADSTILNAEGNGRHFNFDDGQTNATKIIGFTFFNGEEDDDNTGGSIVIRNETNIEFQDCIFDSNRVVDNNDSYYQLNGGAIDIRNQAVPTFTGCTFINNFVTNTDGDGYGGAIYIWGTNSDVDLKAAINFQQCKFIGNFVKVSGYARGGAIGAGKYTKFNNCLFVKNGAIAGVGAGSNDWVEAQGGAIVSSGGNNADGTIIVVSNSTFDQNYLDVRHKNGNLMGTEVFYGWANSNQIKKLYLFNTIISGSYRKLNGEDYITSNESDKNFYSYGDENEAWIAYSAIEGSSDQSWVDVNVFDIAPIYVDTASLDYSLSIKSPLIGQGASSYEGNSAPTVDILGNTRPSPSGSNPDIGAYENSLSSSPSPMPVTGLTGTTKTNSAYLSWTAVKASLSSSDNADDIKYLIYQGDSQVASSVSTTYTVTGLDNGTTYTFSVAAQDTSSGETGATSKLISVTPQYRGPKWYVASSGGSVLADTSDNKDLGSIGSPINHLTSAIEIASAGDTIIMQKGTHTGSANRGIDWNASKSLVIMGDPNYTAENIIIDAGGRDRHFEFDSGEDNTYQVIGLTLYDGKSTDQGGGSVSIGNNSSPVFKKVIFKENVDASSDWRGGGAVNIGNNSTPSFYYCTFDGNLVDRTGTDANSEAYGGAVFVYSTPANMSVLFEGCIFKNNMAKGNQSATGGALGSRDAQVDIFNCLFYGNTAYSSVDGTNNNSPAIGGAITVQGVGYYDPNIGQGEWVGGSVKIINSTIVNNLVKSGSDDNNSNVPGVFLDSWIPNAKILFFNNIVWGNKTDYGSNNYQVWVSNVEGWSGKHLNYNVIQNSSDISSLQDDDSFETDPTFVDSANGDYSLSNASQLIGKGAASYEGVSAPTADILGLSRPNPSGSNPDIGAYENSLSITPYPAQVTNLTAVGGSQSVTLSWDAVAGADSVYKVYQHTSAFSVAAAYFVDTTSAKTYTITGLDNAIRYYFRVSAVNKEGYEGTASATQDITPKYSGPVWWVSTSGNDDTNEGSSGSPFGSIEHALELVSAGDTVMLKPGTYNGSGNRDIEILRNTSSTNFENYKNLVITSEKGAASTIIDAEHKGRHFTISGNTEDTIDSTLQFIGLTFIRGRSSDNGGSFNIQAENYYDSGTNKNRATLMQPKFKDCIFKDNRADGGNNGSLGGAFHISDGAPIFENCVFDSNYSNNGGGAINITGNNQYHRDILWFRDCTFKNNRADDAGLSQGGGGNTNWGVRGGAVWLGFGMDISFINCVFENNEAVESNRNDGVYGGALSISQQWAHEVDPMVRIYNSRFTNNVTRQEASGGAQSHGGAIYAGAPFTMVNSLVDSNRAAFDVTNGTGRGGGLYIDGQTQWIDGNEVFAKSILVNNTIVDNYANGGSGAPYSGEGGGIFLDRSNQQRGVWFNNIIWGNRTANTTDTFWHNMNPVNSDQFKIDTDYNDLEFSEHYPYFMGSNSYNVDPAFYSATNYQLSTGSPLIGAGATSFYGSSAPLVDILGNVRPNPAGSNPDLGAYENSLAESPYPKQVKNLVGVFGSRQVSLSWDANTETDIKKYLVYMSTTMNFEPTPADSVDETTATSYTVTGLTNNTEYHFRIAAVDSSGYRGAYSDTVSVTPEYLGPNWWVSVQNGSDDTGDGSIELPFSSIQWALKETSHADTIRIMPGTYYEHSFSNYDPQSTQPQSTGRFDLTIVGMNSTGEVIVDAQKNNRHMMINGGFTPDMQISMTFRNIHFTNGEGRDEDGFNGGGSIYLAKITAKFVNCHFSNNQATAGVGGWSPGGALNIYSSTVKIISCTFEDNFSQIRGGAINIDWYDENDEVDVEIINSTFTRNDVQINDGEQMSALGGAIYFGASRNLRLKIQDSIFSDNRVRNNNSGQGCAGGVIGSMGQDPQDDWSNIEPVIIDRNIFMDNGCDCGPGTWAGGSVIDVGWNIDISNSLFAQNYTQSNDGISGFVIRHSPQAAGAEMTMVNNTIVRNQLRNQNGSVNTDGSPISAFGGSEVTIFNNIIWDNESNQVFSFSGDVGFNEDYNNLEDLTGQQFGANTLSEEPRFADPDNDNYRLGATSPLIDKGTQSFMGHNAPIKDVRGYYRIETPDIGAYEAGASKYILTLVDDIEENKDTTFVKLSQELKVTVTTGDIDGNVVTDSDEPISWDIFPNQKYARVGTDAETTTSNGTASATIIVTSQTKGKGFRFRVNVYVGEGFEKSDIYVIEEIVTGAPPPVVDLTISPSTWTSQPDFTLNWGTPTWSAQRDLIGAVVEITDGINVIPDYMEFPPGDTLTNYSFTAPEAGQYDVRLWLTGELGNEERDSARTVTAYFDNIQPSEFNIHWPNEGSWVSDKPQFRWEISGDYPSGIKIYHLFLNEQHYAAFDPGQVNYDNPNDEVYIVAPTSIPDGYHSWHVEIWDLADNITWSNDTINFGVDITPPNISHPGPLGTIDEGVTTPAINVNITDGASGVKYANLHYRRSGSGGGFVAVDLLSGPVSIPGSDIKSEGIEYYIDTEDNVGNRGFWPSDTTFHSVRVRSENSITTAQRWSNGIPGGTDSTNYLFFSIPFEVSNAKSAITSVMGPPDEFNYRLYAYNNGWQENPSSVTMGNAYFFIFDPDKYPDTPNLSFDFGVGVSTPTTPPYGVNVSSGQWKFFGSPYNFNVSLDNVYTEDGTNVRDAGSIYTWGGSWSSVSTLQPWRGYIYKSGGATKLNIDGRGGSFGKMAKVLIDPDNVAMDATEWTVNIIATTGNARDELNAVGVRHMAKDGYDRLDEFEPPAVPGDVVLRIDNRDREESPDLYAIDIRKPNEQGHYWNLQVFTPTNGNRTYITFDGLGYIPQEYDVFLINKTTQQAKNLEWESSYHFANTGSDRYLRQDLRLVIGTKDFVNENNAGVNLYPDAFTLSQNYPNPFNPQTSIMISLEQDAQVDLVIYNLLGEEITRLATNENRPAGYYTFIWNGTNDVGRKVSTGVYFYHAMIKNSQGRVVLNKTRKMIFLK